MFDYEWYCPHCDLYLTDEEVVGQLEQDPICDPKMGGCGNPVDGIPDLQEGSFDTLEEKYL